MCLLGLWWGLPQPLHPDESVLQEFNLAILHGSLKDGVFFSYGNLTQIFYLLFIWPASLFPAHETAVALALGRLASAFLAACLPLILGNAAKMLLGEKEAKAVSWTAALTPAVVTYGHFATADMPQLAGLAVGFWSAVRLIKNHSPRDFVLTGLILGLGTALKYQGWLMGFVALVSARRPLGPLENRPRSYFLMVFLAFGLILGFFIGMPWLWTDPWLALKWWLYNALSVPVQRGMAGSAAWLAHAKNLPALLGPVLLIPCLMGLVRSIIEIRLRRFPSIILLAAWTPFYLLTGSFRFTPARFSLGVLPAMIFYAGWELSRWPKLIQRIAAVGAFAFALWLDLGFLFNSRSSASEWLANQAPQGSTIELSPYTAKPPQGVLIWTGYVPARQPLMIKPIPFFLKPLASLVMAEELELAERERRRLIPEPAPGRFSLEALSQRRPQFVILSDLYVQRYRYAVFAQANPAHARYYLDFWEGRMDNYALAWNYKFFPQHWWAPRPEFVDPEIRIYRRKKGNE